MVVFVVTFILRLRELHLAVPNSIQRDILYLLTNVLIFGILKLIGHRGVLQNKGYNKKEYTNYKVDLVVTFILYNSKANESPRTRLSPSGHKWPLKVWLLEIKVTPTRRPEGRVTMFRCDYPLCVFGGLAACVSTTVH